MSNIDEMKKCIRKMLEQTAGAVTEKMLNELEGMEVSQLEAIFQFIPYVKLFDEEKLLFVVDRIIKRKIEKMESCGGATGRR